MNLLFFIASFTFFIWIIRNVLFWTALWQLKDYLLDRVFIHLKETSQGKNLLLSPLFIAKWFGIFLYGFVVTSESWLPYYHVMVALFFSLQAVLVMKELAQGLLKKPVFTLKALFISCFTMGAVAFFFAFPLMDYFLWMLILEMLIPFLVSGLVLFFGIPTELYRDFVIQKATNIIVEKKNLLVIGVTGSYGKSSTKDYIAQILSQRFNVVKTPGTQNTPIGIANTILSKLRDDTQVFIVEMGAYARGEIAGICQIVHPTIGIITAVNHQHLSLFKNLATTMAAKYELIESLPKDGLALFNGNNANARTLFQKTKKKKKVLFYVQRSDKRIAEKGEEDSDTSIIADDVVVHPKNVQFTVVIKGTLLHLNAPLLGDHAIENILPGIYIADYLGMSAAQIADGVANLKPIPRTMARLENEDGFIIIDDTFNANPDAVLAACRYLSIYKKKKLLVLQPMIELGKKAKSEHYAVAKTVASICDVLLVTNKNFYESITQGVRDGGGKCEVRVGNAHEHAQFIRSNMTKGDVVLFEGKEAEFVLNKI